jgi:hypothetical protein
VVWISTITKSRLDELVAAGVLQMDMFEQGIAESEGKDGER